MDSTFYARWLAGLKGGPMVAWAAGVTGAQWAFLVDYAPAIPVVARIAFATVTFLVCCLLYFINPKSREWMPASGSVQDLFRVAFDALLDERVPALAALIHQKIAPVPAAAAVPSRVVAAPPVAPATPPSPPLPPQPARGIERTLTNDEALAEIMQTLQQASVALQGRIHASQ